MKENIPNNIEVGERIRKIREDLKLNRESFAERIDISDVFLGQIERGERSLSLKTLCRIVAFTGSSTDFILFGKSSENKIINKINRILILSSDNMISYMYQIITYSFNFFKTQENINKRKIS